MGWKTELHNAKLGHRPRLKGNWERDGMAETFSDLVREFETQENYQSYCLDADPQCSVPALLDAQTLTKEEFHKYEKRSIPCIINNIPKGYDDGKFVGAWGAQTHWTFEALQKDADLMERRFKCGEDDDEKNIKVKLRHFLSYTEENKDDSPLYIFDSHFPDDKHGNRLLQDYRVPSYFADDLFGLISESRR